MYIESKFLLMMIYKKRYSKHKQPVAGKFSFVLNYDLNICKETELLIFHWYSQRLLRPLLSVLRKSLQFHKHMLYMGTSVNRIFLSHKYQAF